MFPLWLLAFVAIVVSIPFARFFIKRCILYTKLVRLCKRRGYELKATHRFWFLGNRNRKSLDLYIKTATTVFSIKLFGCIRKNTKIIVKENGDYFIRKYYAFLSSKSQALLFSDSVSKPFNKYQFEIKDNAKPVRNIILQHPAAIEMRNQPQHGSEIILDNGDILYGAEIYSLNAFIKLL